MKVLCHAPKAGPAIRLKDGTVMFDVLDNAGNAVTLFFEDIAALTDLAKEMMREATVEPDPRPRPGARVIGFYLPCSK